MSVCKEKKWKQPNGGQKETFLLNSGYSGTGSLLPFSETFGISKSQQTLAKLEQNTAGI